MGKAEPFTVGGDDAGQTLAALLRKHGLATTWNEARRLIDGGKLFVDGERAVDAAARPARGAQVEVRATAKRPQAEVPGRIVFDDAQLVVFDKPAGVSSVPYEERETGTAMDLIRGHWRRETGRARGANEQALHVVHRIDKDTSGLLVFAKTKGAERALAARFRTHDVERTYLCVVHGALTDRRLESRLVEDRGDGLRGSTRAPGQGKRAVTHVKVVEALSAVATLCEVRLETGKTHQIRIHLAENGHPLVGERVYIRDFTEAGQELLPSARLLLHAATLGVVHPTTLAKLRWESPLPAEFTAEMAALKRVS